MDEDAIVSTVWWRGGDVLLAGIRWDERGNNGRGNNRRSRFRGIGTDADVGRYVSMVVAIEIIRQRLRTLHRPFCHHDQEGCLVLEEVLRRRRDHPTGTGYARSPGFCRFLGWMDILI